MPSSDEGIDGGILDALEPCSPLSNLFAGPVTGMGRRTLNLSGDNANR